MEIKLTVDRTEEGKIICLDEDENDYIIEGDFSEGDILLCQMENGSITVIGKINEETEEKKEEMSERLRSLFSRGDK